QRAGNRGDTALTRGARFRARRKDVSAGSSVGDRRDGSLRDLRRSDQWPRELRRRPLPLREAGRRRQDRPRLQSRLQPALRLHALRNLPAAPEAEPTSDSRRGGREDAWGALAAPLSSRAPHPSLLSRAKRGIYSWRSELPVLFGAGCARDLRSSFAEEVDPSSLRSSG